MKTVYKYMFVIDDVQHIALPRGAEILHVAMQHGVPTIWALVDPAAPKENRLFRVAGTGHPIEDWKSLIHRATFFSGPFVWHLFEQDIHPGVHSFDDV